MFMQDVVAKTAHLKEKLGKLVEEMDRLKEREVQMLAAPGQQMAADRPLIPARWRRAGASQASSANNVPGGGRNEAPSDRHA
jgi:hypothetical protein